MKRNIDITKISRVVGILSVVLLFVSAYLPWINILEDGVHKATLTGMKTIGTRYRPAEISLIFAALYFITIFIHKLWIKIAGIFFGVVVFAWSIKDFVSLSKFPNAEKLFSPEMYTQYTSTREAGLYIFIIAALLILAAAVTPYYPEKDRKG